MKDRYLLILLGLGLVAMVGVFFLYVPILPTIASVVVLISLLAMFSLGYHVGQNTPAISDENDGLKPTELPLAHGRMTDVHERFRDVA